MMTTRMKHLLLIVDAFPPDFAPRMGYLCRCLETMPEASKEWQVTVIAPDEGGRLYDIPYERTEIHRIPLHPTSGPFRSLRWSLGFLGTLLFDLKGRRFRRCVEQICAGRDFDLLLCSTYYTFPLNTALSFSRSHQIPFIADLRDIAEEYTENDFFQHPLPHLMGLERLIAHLYRSVSIRRRNKVLRQADIVTSVSPWHTQTVVPFLSSPERAFVIYNGFDGEQFVPQKMNTEKFIITYTGRLYNRSIRDPRLLFPALRTLMDTLPTFAQDAEVHWYTDDRSWEEAEELSRKHHTEALSRRCPSVPISQMPAVLNRSSVVLVVSNRTPDNGPKGILTTKFFEALGCERPVLCLRSDEGLLEDAIRATGIGCAARTQQDAEDFLRKKYLQWKSEGRTTQSIVPEQRDFYSRQSQACQFLDLFHTLTDRK